MQTQFTGESKNTCISCEVRVFLSPDFPQYVHRFVPRCRGSFKKTSVPVAIPAASVIINMYYLSTYLEDEWEAEMQRGGTHGPTARAKLRASWTETRRAAMSEKMRASWTEARRERMSERMRQRHQDPAFKKKMTAGFERARQAAENKHR